MFHDPYLVSGNSFVDDANAISQLDFHAYFVTNGELRLRYKKNTRMFNEYKNGAFQVTLNREPIHTNDDIYRDYWEVFTHEIKAGFNEI
jgi:hypothetical protein